MGTQHTKRYVHKRTSVVYLFINSLLHVQGVPQKADAIEVNYC